MSNNENKVPIWFWVVSALLLVWNLMGVMNFVQQVTATEEALRTLPDQQREMIMNTPVWVYTAFCIAVFSGTLGGLFLLLRKRAAKALFILSILAAAVQSFYSWSVALNDFETYGTVVITFTLLIFGAGLFAIWFSGLGAKKGWLR